MTVDLHSISRWQTPSARLAKGSGSSNIISLNAIKREAGDRWGKMREPVCTRLEAMFRQRLGPSDFFVPISETSYLVVMPASTPEEGQIGCLRISYDLHASLLGSCGVEHLEIARAETVGDDVLELTQLSQGEIIQMAERAGLVLAPSGGGHLDFVGPNLRRHPARTSHKLPNDVDLSFHPVWDATYEVIRAYRCAVRRKYLGSVIENPADEARELAQTTLGTLDHVSDVLQNHLKRNERFIVNTPISYAALTTPLARMEFTAACRRLSCDLRPHLVFKIEDIPVGAPQSRIVELVTALVPFCRAVIAKVPWRERRLDIYRVIGLKAVGLGLDRVPQCVAVSEIERLCRYAARNRLVVFLDDVADTGILQLAMASGVQWLSGPSVAPAVLEPGPLVRLDRNTLLNNVAA